MFSDNKKPLVSILINCFNTSSFISKAINSVINQSYKNWELIIWDDGSKDNTPDIARKFTDKRIKFFCSKRNFGLGPSRIKATKKLSGSLITILDSDDYYNPKKLSKQVEVFKNFPNISICATWAKVYNEKSQLKRLIKYNENNHDVKKKLKFINLLPHSSIMYKKIFAQKVGWYSNNLEYSQDHDLSLKLLNHGDLHIIKEYLTFLVDRKSNMTNSKNLRSLRLKEYIFILKDNLKKKNTNEEKKITNLILDICLLKLSIVEIKINFIENIKKLFLIFIKNPKIIFKFNTLKKITENKI